MQVKEIMTMEPVTITKQTLLTDALDMMKEKNIRRLLVVDEKGRLLDIVTKKDLNEMSPSPATSLSIFELNYLLAKTTIGDILKVRKDRPDHLITIAEDALVGQAAVLLRENKIGALPVLRGEEIAGIVTETDIFDVFVNLMGYKEPGTRMIIQLEEDKEGIIKEISEIIYEKQGNINQLLAYKNNAGKYVLELGFQCANSEEAMKAIADRGYQIINFSK